MRESKWREPAEDAARIIAAFSLGEAEGRKAGKSDAQFTHDFAHEFGHDNKCRQATRAEERERERWQKSLGYETPEAAWTAVNKGRAEERIDALKNAVDAIRAACTNSHVVQAQGGAPIRVICPECTAAVTAIYALPGALPGVQESQ